MNGLDPITAEAISEHMREIRHGKPRSIMERYPLKCGHCGQVYPEEFQRCKFCKCELCPNPRFKDRV